MRDELESVEKRKKWALLGAREKNGRKTDAKRKKKRSEEEGRAGTVCFCQVTSWRGAGRVGCAA